MTFTSDTQLKLLSSVEPFTGNIPQDPNDCHSQRVEEIQNSSTVIISPGLRTLHSYCSGTPCILCLQIPVILIDRTWDT